MPTTVTKTIGSAGGRDYSTVQSWEDALPASLVTGDTVQIGQCFNDSEFVVPGTVVTFSGSTTDATHTITLTAPLGQSFRDNASVQTNPQRYDASKGVALRATGAYAHAIVVSEDNVILDSLQIRSDNQGKGVACNFQVTTITNSIVEGTRGGQGAIEAKNLTAINCTVIQRALFASGGSGITFGYPTAASITNCTIVNPSDITTTGDGIAQAGSTAVAVQNCAIFGFATSVNNVSKFTGNNNCSDKAIGFGTSNQASKTYANQFVNTSDSTRDFRLKTGSDCLDNGATISAASPDIAGTVRPAGTAYDIGCWELVVSGPTLSIAVFN